MGPGNIGETTDQLSLALIALFDPSVHSSSFASTQETAEFTNKNLKASFFFIHSDIMLL